MKTHLLLTGLIVSLLLAQSAPAAILPFDENGNGAFGPGVLQPDPGPGGLPAVLTYRLPFAGVPGDVQLTDAGVAGNPFLDVIRFNGNGTLVFYSDNTDGLDSLGDTNSPPTAFYPNLRQIPEVGPEGNSGVFYTPGPNDPGFDPSLPTYHLISDGTVPEPASISLFGVGAALGGLIVLKRRRK